MIDFSKYPLPRRWRHHVQANLYFPFNEKIPDPESYPPLIDSVDWSDVFENEKPPNCLDIGSAWSRFLMKFALENPSTNILGLEIRKQTVDYAKNVINSENINNADVFWYSVVNGLDFLKNNSIDKIFYFFPDPWFKGRHKKRRAFDEKFLENCHKKLKSDGEIFLQTDILEVHKYHIDKLDEFGKFEIIEPKKEDWNLPTTDKEDECIRKGFKYWRLICVKN